MGKKKQQAPAKPAGGMAIAAGWPVYETMISREWDEEGALAEVLVARRSPNSGKVAAALFLVDLACLGVKSAQVKLYKDPAEYDQGLRAHAQRVQPMAHIDFNTAAKVVLSGLEYAESLGFKPDPVFAQARPLLSGAEPSASPTIVRTGGPEGKPLFVNGPYDDVDRVIAQLRRAVGDDGFHVMLGQGGDMLYSDLLDEDEGEGPRRR